MTGMKRLITLLLLTLSTYTYGQSSDDLLVQAKSQAFDQKNYPEAIKTLKQAIEKSPDYLDLHIFLGRVYTWSDQVEEARKVFKPWFEKKVDSEDFYLAYASLEYWNDEENRALEILKQGLEFNPGSEDLLFLQARIFNSLDQYEKAEESLNILLTKNPKHTEGRELLVRIRDLTAKNAIGITYNFVHFDKQFADNWHIVGLSYKRATSIGSFIFRTNLAQKFGDNGIQFELEGYPRLSKMFYLYTGVGYSNQVGIFPKYRTGVSLYANLPQSFEGEIGYRQLHFNDDVWMYTASVGKYYQNLWFNLRTYLTPGNSNLSHSYTGTVRYYTKGANDYLGFQIGTGISPDENRSNLLEPHIYKMKTYKIGLDYNFTLGKRNVFWIQGTYFNQEYLPKTKGNQYDLTLGFNRTF
jgi:YaiO family outer membrane protein